jgi:hypothetical protein
MHTDVYLRTLARAALIAGGVDALALKLRVTPHQLATWLRFGNPPLEVFLGAVDIVVENDARPQAMPKHQPPHASKT